MTSYLAYKRQMAVLDADDDITWITVKGNHIPIKKGENKEEAIKSFFESKGKAQKSPRKPKATRAVVLVKKKQKARLDSNISILW